MLQQSPKFDLDGELDDIFESYNIASDKTNFCSLRGRRMFAAQLWNDRFA